MSPWLLVAGDFTPHGGMDVANYNLAAYLARQETAVVHLVAHRVSPDLGMLPNVRVHRAARPFGAHRLGEPILRAMAGRWHHRLHAAGVRTIANGGNADAGDVNWVHYVHAAYAPTSAVPTFRMATLRARHLRDESHALARARIVICNSQRTADDVVTRLDVPPARIRVVYYGIDPERFATVDDRTRAAAREALGLRPDRRVAVFAGALGDRRKGFDTLFSAWRDLCGSDWDVDLLVSGAGRELSAWRARAKEQLPPGRIRFLGFHRDMPSLLAASDLLVHPARYEPYGLSVHEALCRGIPAIVSASAGIGERYPEGLRGLLLHDPDSPSELVALLRCWRADRTIGQRVAVLSELLRRRTWRDMSRDIIRICRGER